jgi:hypothetical protein
VPITTPPRAGQAFGLSDTRGKSIAQRTATTESDTLDPVVRWAVAKKSQLEDESNGIRERQRRNTEYYKGRQTFDLKGRPRWMNSVVDNESFFAVERWTSMVTDNKPKITFSAYRKEDQLVADVANAAFDDDYDTMGYQAALEDAVKMSRIDGWSFVRDVYDPRATPEQGRIVWKSVSAKQVMVNAEARTIDEAVVLLYTYVEPTSIVLARWPHLKDELRKERDTADDKEKYGRMRSAPGTSTNPTSQLSWTPGAVGQTTGTGFNSPAYAATTVSAANQGGSARVIDEFWLRHPNKTVTVKKLKWTMDGLPACKPKTLKYYDVDHNVIDEEPLVTVVTEGNVVYEWPLSTALLHEHIGEHFGGIKVLSMHETLVAQTTKVEVQKYPGGRRLVVVDGRHKASDGNNPFVDGHWPFVRICAYRNGDSFDCFGDIDIIRPMQDGKNRLVSTCMNAADMTANPIWRLPYGRKTPNEMITNAPGAIIDEDTNSLRYGKREKGPDMPAYVMQLVEYFGQRITKLTGLNDVGMGGKLKGNQAAETVSMYQDSASLPARSALRNLEQALVPLGKHWLSLASQFYGDPRWVFTRDAVGSDVSHVFVGTDLASPMMVKAKAGSQLPQSPSARLQFSTQILQTPYGTVESFARALEDVGLVDSGSDFINDLRKYVEEFEKSGGNPIKLWGAPGLLALLGGGGKKKSATNRTARNRTPRSQG